MLWLLPWWTSVLFIVVVLAGKWAILTHIAPPDVASVNWSEHLTYQDWIRKDLGWFGTLLTQGLPSTVTVLLGSQSTNALKQEWRRPTTRSFVLVASGALVVALSWVWHTLWYHQPSIGMPFSKDYFTSSYVLLAAGSGAMILGAMHQICDVRALSSLKPLRVLGMNAFAVYLAAELLWKMVLTRWHLTCPDGSSAWIISALKAWLQHAFGNNAGSWTIVAAYISAYWFLALWMYRKNIFLRL